LRELVNMHEPPKPYRELTTSELVDFAGELIRSGDAGRIEINMVLAEVHTRLNDDLDDADARKLIRLDETLEHWLQVDDDRRMGRSRRGRYSDPEGRPPRDCGACMCSMERLEARAKRGD
jgi:hypothetical protein